MTRRQYCSIPDLLAMLIVKSVAFDREVKRYDSQVREGGRKEFRDHVSHSQRQLPDKSRRMFLNNMLLSFFHNLMLLFCLSKETFF